MQKRQVPELSLLSYVNGTNSDQVKFVDGLFLGLKEYGFIILNDHVVDSKLCDKAYDLVHEFFSLSLENKLKYVCPKGKGQRGYTAFGLEHAKDSLYPDLKEFYHVGREVLPTHEFSEFYPPNIWPEEVKEFRQTLSTLYGSLDITSQIILSALGKALDVSEDYFISMIKEGNSILRPIHYPKLSDHLDLNAVRSAAHEDINLITILMGATTSGLQLLDRDGLWLDVLTKKGELVVDSGDMMGRLTNDVLKATTHRVINPKDDNNEARYSMPFFVHPNPKVTLSCIPSCIGSGKKYGPINAHEFLLQRLKEIGLM